MELADLMGHLSEDTDRILNPYKHLLVTNSIMEQVSNDIISELRKYQIQNWIYNLNVRVKEKNDLIISFQAPIVEVAFLYLHIINHKFLFNIEVYKEKG